MNKTMCVCVTYTRHDGRMVAWGDPVETEPRLFWLPLSEDAVEQARKMGTVANRCLVVENDVVVAFE